MAKAVLTFIDHGQGFEVQAEFTPRLTDVPTSQAQQAALCMLSDMQTKAKSSGANVEQRTRKLPLHKRAMRWMFG